MEAFLLRNIILLDEVSFLPRAAGSCENIGLNEFNLEFPITSNIALHCQHIYSQSTKSQKKAWLFVEVEFVYFLDSLLSNCLSDLTISFPHGAYQTDFLPRVSRNNFF